MLKKSAVTLIYYLQVAIVYILIYVFFPVKIAYFNIAFLFNLALLILPSVIIALVLSKIFKNYNINMFVMLLVLFIIPVLVSYLSLDRFVFFGLFTDNVGNFYEDLIFTLSSFVSIFATYGTVFLIRK